MKRRIAPQGAGRTVALALLLATSLAAAAQAGGGKAEKTMGEKTGASGATQVATLGGGCFWCVEAVYERTAGVKSVVSGYAGGTVPNPSYEQVCNGTTGHAEVVQVEFDPETISYAKILELFWKSHDPTTPNRQGADVGPQYRSLILYADETQRRTAEESRRQAAGLFPRPIVTEIRPLAAFYRAEDYHQDYYANNPYAGYCSFVIRPKLQKLGLE